jgi:hypothetical protein
MQLVVIAVREEEEKKENRPMHAKREKMKQTPHGFVRHLLLLYSVQQTYTMIKFSSSSFDTQAR